MIIIPPGHSPRLWTCTLQGCHDGHFIIILDVSHVLSVDEMGQLSQAAAMRAQLGVTGATTSRLDAALADGQAQGGHALADEGDPTGETAPST